MQINDRGVVVFEAALDDGRFGVFTGPDAVQDKVLATGDMLDGGVFAWIRMGELNRAGQLALLTRDLDAGEHQVWRVDGLNPRHRMLDKLRRWKELLEHLLRWLRFWR